MKLIANRLLLSRACFLLSFTIVKLNENKMKKNSKKLGLQHRRTKQEKARQNDPFPLCRKAGISNKGYRSNCQILIRSD
jgi:hypothetical protein